MIDETIHTFDYCIDKANERSNADAPVPKKHLMLGNGFSIALFPDKFDYKALAERVESDDIDKLFNKLNISDFEHLKRRLIDALKLIEVYPEHEKIAAKINSNIVSLGTELINIISKSHPEILLDIDKEHYDKCHKFLEHFNDGNKYTFNYDLLLYWAYMKFRNGEYKALKHDDGFRGDLTLIWDINRITDQNVYYLHGAMHIFDNNGIIRKLKWRGKNVTLQNQVRSKINNDKYPMFISEGTADHKFSRIRGCSYLEHAFYSLDKIKDNLFIFGHSLGDEDDHVFHRTNINSKLKNIFISIFGDIEHDNNKSIIKKVKKWEKIDLIKNQGNQDLVKNYYFYDAESADMWGPQVPPVAPCISP